jgi:UDP-N-acetylmuramoylalanine--D-glutamate ligase
VTDRLQELLEQPAGRRVLVVGLARSGVVAARLLARRGAVLVGVDRRAAVEAAEELQKLGMRLVLGQQPSSLVDDVDLVVLSPGVHRDAPLILAAEARGLPVLGELELGVRLVRVPILAVTGTNGKSTTAALCAHLLRRAGKRVFLGGNIGNPACNLALEGAAVDWAVLEVSSYQLEHLTAPAALAPEIAIWLNLTPDHLERHGTMAAYAQAKRRLFEGQGPKQTAVFFADDPLVSGALSGLSCRPAGFGREMGRLTSDGLCIQDRLLIPCGRALEYRVDNRSLRGGHNAENAAAAVLAALAAGTDPAALQSALDSFTGLPHRLQSVAVIDGVEYINDSKGTNVDAVQKSLAAIEAPIVLIAGGRGKGTPYLPLREAVAARVRHLVLLGEDADRLAEELAGTAPAHRVDSLPEAVQLGRRLAEPGQVVLLSPACASFDMFKDFEERGEVFSRAVLALRERK